MKHLGVLSVAGVLSASVSACSSGDAGGSKASRDAANDATAEGAAPPNESGGGGAVDGEARSEGAAPPDERGGDGAADSGPRMDGSVREGGDAGADAADAADANAADAGDAGEPCANSLFCDNFEEYDAGGLPSPTWGANQSGGSLVVDTTRAHSGKQSVKMSAAATTGYRSIMMSLAKAGVVPIANNHLFGRMAFYLDSSPTTSVHWTFIDGFGATSAGYHALYRYGGQTPAANGNTLMANYDTPDSYGTPPVGPSSDCWLHSTAVVPTAAWSCAEWEFDGPNNTMRFWLDGTAITDLTMTGTGQGCVHEPSTFSWLAPTFSRVDLGWESYQADAARTIWIDDVAIGEVRLGCAP